MQTKLYRNPHIFIQNSPVHGKGVFTNADILFGEIIEQCLVIHPQDKTANNLDPNYAKYFFLWPHLKENWRELLQTQESLSPLDISYPVCVLGYGMLFNHSLSPNVIFETNTEDNLIEFKAKRKINAGEELFICYNENLNF